MTRYNGENIDLTQINTTYDVVVVGSGPGGAACAAKLSQVGIRVAVVEEGNWVDAIAPKRNLGDSFAKLYRDGGTSVLMGTPPVPFLQGRAVGGSSVVNGAISWRLPERVYKDWLKEEPQLKDVLPWQRLCELGDAVEKRLNILPTPPDISGARNTLMKKGADALGLENRAISRNVKNCKSSSMCLHSCPNDAKLSMDKTYLLDAEKAGCDIYFNTTATKIISNKRRVEGITCVTASKIKFTLKAKRVVLAASAIQTPALLMRSHIKQGPVGQHFQCHPGVSVSGEFAEEVHQWDGATQGHETIGLCAEGIKFETTAMDISVLGMRYPGTGIKFMESMQRSKRRVFWASAIKSSAHGSVHNFLGKTFVKWGPSVFDMLLFRRGTYMLGKMFFAAGAKSVDLGVYPWGEIKSEAELEIFYENASLNPKDYTFAVTHMFGTCRMGSDPASSVVDLKFQHHHIEGLYISDSSVFMTNTGVNPQTSILVMSLMCAENILESL